MIVQNSDTGGLLQNAMRKIGKKRTRSIHVQAFVSAGIDQTMKRPVVCAFQHPLFSDYPMQWEVPADWVYPVHGDQLDLYKHENTRVLYDHTGVVLL